MLLSARRLQHERVLALDGDGGRVDDVYFDDVGWNVRYLVVCEDRKIPQRQRLVAPAAVLAPVPMQPLRVSLTRSDIDRCPGIDADPPVSYQFDLGRIAYYGDPTFLTWAARAASDPHLRAASIVIGYGIQTPDGTFGHVADLLIEAGDWSVQAFVLEGTGWLPGRPRLVAAAAVQGIDWAQRRIRVSMTRAQIRDARPSLTGASA